MLSVHLTAIAGIAVAWTMNAYLGLTLAIAYLVVTGIIDR